MHVLTRRGWERAGREVTAESAALGRRAALTGAGALGLTVGGGLAPAAPVPDGPAPNPRYAPGRALSRESDVTTFNNYYEFGSQKTIWREAEKLPQAPWSIAIEGMVKAPRSIALDDLLKQVTLEERIYRHRCVEAWAMTVPWTGFPLSRLIALAEPLGSAKYLVFTSRADENVMPGLQEDWYPWPYTEGLTIEEAGNELAFVATGLYGKTLPPQNGGPIRLAVPWKYGFKSAKAIVKIVFTDERPTSYWETISPTEYGFWANVNPDVPHPRWSQATERLLGGDERVPTKIYNGYGEFVAGLYAGKPHERLFT
jgi:sulfoxide reductase catalytic subunit YedY